MVAFEGCARRMGQIEPFLEKIGLSDLEEAKALCLSRGIDVEQIVKGVQAIAFENAVWAYTLGAAAALKAGAVTAAEAAAEADVVLCMLSSGPVCNDVLLGSPGIVSAAIKARQRQARNRFLC